MLKKDFNVSIHLKIHSQRKRKKLRHMTNTHTNSQPSLFIKPKNMENLNDITNEISIIKNNILEEKKKRSKFHN